MTSQLLEINDADLEEQIIVQEWVQEVNAMTNFVLFLLEDDDFHSEYIKTSAYISHYMHSRSSDFARYNIRVVSRPNRILREAYATLERSMALLKEKAEGA